MPNNALKVIIFLLGFLIGYVLAIKVTSIDYTLAPKETRYLMWVEKCPKCGGELECGYSIINESGYKECKTCQEGIEIGE